MAETQPAKKELTVIGQICATVDRMDKGLADRLSGTGIDVKRFIGTAKTSIQNHNDKKSLEKADRESLFNAIMLAATDGLVPDNREAALVVRNTNVGSKDKPEYKLIVGYMPMVQGLIKLARNTGEVLDIDGYVVHEKDTFSFQRGTAAIPFHDVDKAIVPNGWFGNRGAPIGVWAFVKLTNGEIKVVMLPKERIDRIATRSKIAANYNPSTGKDWEEWWIKAAIRNVLKRCPRSNALNSALDQDSEEFDLDDAPLPPDEDPKPVNPVNDKPKTETKAAQRIKAKTKAEEEKKPDPALEENHDVIDADYTDAPDDGFEQDGDNNQYDEDEIPV